MNPPAEPSSPQSPGSPATAETVFSRTSTCVEQGDVEKEALKSEIQTPLDAEAATDPGPTDGECDPESLAKLPRRATIAETVKRVGTSFSERVPPHWRANYLSEGRHSSRIDDHPEGYPRFAAFLNSDENFLVARRYGLMHTRIMLYRQAELAKLEQALFDLDREDAQDEDRALRGVKFVERGDRGEDRVELIDKIEEKLKQYGGSLMRPAELARISTDTRPDDIVMRHRAMQALPQASTRNYSSVKNYLGHNAPLSVGDKDLFHEDTDFAALVDPKEAVSLDAFIEDCLSMVPCRLTKVCLLCILVCLLGSLLEAYASSNTSVSPCWSEAAVPYL